MGGGDRREGTHAYCDMRGEGARGGEREAGGEAYAEEGDGRARAQAAPAQSSKKAHAKFMPSPEIMQHLHYLHPHTHTSASRHPRTHLRTRTRAPPSAPAPAHLRTRTRTRIRRSCDTTIPTLQHKPCSREHSAGATHRRPRTHARTRSPHTPRTGGGAGPSVLVCSSGWCPNGVAPPENK